MVELETALSILQTVSIIIGVFYYIMTLQNSNRNQQLALKAQEQALETRQAQVFMALYRQFNDPEFVKRKSRVANFEFTDFEDYDRKFGPLSNSEEFDDHFSVATFYEGIGILIKRGLIDPGLIDDMMSDSVLTFWVKYRDVFYGIRRKYNQPTAAEHIEYLYESILKIVREQHGKTVASGYEINP